MQALKYVNSTNKKKIKIKIKTNDKIFTNKIFINKKGNNSNLYLIYIYFDKLEFK
jgi:hypothetical protein